MVFNLELKDGSRVIGTSGMEYFKMHSEILGDIKLSPEQLTAIEFLAQSNRVQVVATNRDTLSGELDTREIRLQTSFGKISVPVNTVRHLSVTRQFTPRPTSLVAFWPGNGNANDVIGNSPTVPVGPMRYVDGMREQAFFFSGDDAYLLVHPTPSLDVGKGDGFTFEGWINPSTVNADMLVFEFERELGTASGTDVGMELAIHRATQGGRGVGCLYSNIKDTEDAGHIFTSPPNLLVPGVWQHVALTYDKHTGTGGLYLNGKMVASANLGVFTPQTSFPNLLLGAKTTYNSERHPGNLFAGCLEEFGIHDRALSATEIQAIYDIENGNPRRLEDH
jgi:hypothetical protein